jgi:hypothetical protein
MLVGRAAVLRLAVGTMITCSACAPDVKDLKTWTGESCEREYKGKTHVVGEPDCFLAFPKQTLSGYWHSVFEGDAFYATRADVVANRGAIAIYFSREANVGAETSMRGEGVYTLNFVGRVSDRDGFFGHLGWSKRGVLVERIISMEAAPELNRYLLPPSPPPPSPNNSLQRP